MQSILTDEQKATMKAARRKMKTERKDHPGKKHHQELKESKTVETPSVQQ